MEIEIKIKREELDEMRVSKTDFKNLFIDDLDRSRDYPGFNVRVVIVEDFGEE